MTEHSSVNNCSSRPEFDTWTHAYIADTRQAHTFHFISGIFFVVVFFERSFPKYSTVHYYRVCFSLSSDLTHVHVDVQWTGLSRSFPAPLSKLQKCTTCAHPIQQLKYGTEGRTLKYAASGRLILCKIIREQNSVK